jgi:hypothetical protein
LPDTLYHNHLLTEDFSNVDLPTAWAIGHYLCAPSGSVLRHTIQEGTVKIR